MASNIKGEKSPPGMRQRVYVSLGRERACKGCWMLAQRKPRVLTRNRGPGAVSLKSFTTGHIKKKKKKGNMCVSWASLASPITASLQNG